MRDKGLDMFLTVLFGVGGIAALLLAWLQPMPTSEKVLTTSIGPIGLIWASSRIHSLISKPTRTGYERHHPEVEVKEEPYWSLLIMEPIPNGATTVF